MATFAIDDGHGNQLTAGLSEHEARSTAQRMADSRGESVYLYEMRFDREDDSDGEPESEEFAPMGVSASECAKRVCAVADCQPVSESRVRITGLDETSDDVMSEVRAVLPAGWTAEWSDDDIIIDRVRA
jgi:hypothetical protein